MEKFKYWQSPLGAVAEGFPAGLSEITGLVQTNLRGNPEDPAFIGAVQESIDISLPVEPGTVSGNRDLKALWLGPDEWMIISKPEVDVLDSLKKSLADKHVAVTDVSANRVILQISGPHIRDVLMKSCELDFHPRVFSAGQVVQTLVAKSPAIIEQLGNGSFHLYVRNSFSRYVGEWLTDAFREYAD